MFILTDMVYIKADFLPKENSSTQWIVVSLIALLILISYFLARILYRKKLLQKRISRQLTEVLFLPVW